MSQWSEADLARLVLEYPRARTSDLAASFGRSVDGVYNKIRKLGLKKDTAFILTTKSANGKKWNSGQYNRKHGYANPGNPTYVCWAAMRQRCEVSAHKSFASYGGRGIRVCDEWREFTNFLRDMGERPSNSHTIGRIDNDINYEPGNCRWETHKEQQNNRRNNRLITAYGRTQTVSQWADEVGITWGALWKRLDAGWDIEAALTQPMRNYPRGPRGVA